MNKVILDESILTALNDARANYGNKNQILVCMEELNELACVLAKYPRYTDESTAAAELHDKVLDEYADVLIILNHVQNIFDLSDRDISNRIKDKIDRLQRWLSHSKSMQETIDDRTVTQSTCHKCAHEELTEEQDYLDYCQTCLQAQATEGISINYTSKE